MVTLLMAGFMRKSDGQVSLVFSVQQKLTNYLVSLAAVFSFVTKRLASWFIVGRSVA